MATRHQLIQIMYELGTFTPEQLLEEYTKRGGDVRDLEFGFSESLNGYLEDLIELKVLRYHQGQYLVRKEKPLPATFSSQVLLALADQLDQWAMESRQGAWSEHQVKPQEELAKEIRNSVVSGLSYKLENYLRSKGFLR